MTAKDAARQRDDFLEQLDAASTAERIRQLGDPVLIAQEAQREIRTPGAIAVDRKEPLPRRRGFAIAAALVFAFGGFIVPVVGWFVGIVMVAESALWRRWEKAVAIALPFAVGALITVVSWIGSLLSSSGGAQTQEHNPLLPTAYDLWHSGILLGIILIPILGGWLLWRLRRR